MGFEVGNPMLKNTTELTFPQGWIHSDDKSWDCCLVWGLETGCWLTALNGGLGSTIPFIIKQFYCLNERTWDISSENLALINIFDLVDKAKCAKPVTFSTFNLIKHFLYKQKRNFSKHNSHLEFGQQSHRAHSCGDLELIRCAVEDRSNGHQPPGAD